MSEVIIPALPSFRRPGLNDGSRLFMNKYLAVHPTVTLSIVDHYTRVAKDTNKRVVGVVLGEYTDGKNHATSSFGVPFEEDNRDASLWYLDHNYLESMAYMFGKINKKEKIIGWYSTGQRIKPADLEINELFRRYSPHPIFLLVNVQPQTTADDLPFSAYIAYDEPSSDKSFRKSFAHIASGVAQFEAEEVAIEHLLRDVEHLSFSTRATKIADRLNGLRCLEQKLLDITLYLQEVSDGTLAVNARIINNLQNIFNLLPDTSKAELVEAFDSEINASMLTIYIGSVIRSVLALHDLVKNRLDPKLKSDKAEKDRLKKKLEDKAKSLKSDTPVENKK